MTLSSSQMQNFLQRPLPGPSNLPGFARVSGAGAQALAELEYSGKLQRVLLTLEHGVLVKLQESLKSDPLTTGSGVDTDLCLHDAQLPQHAQALAELEYPGKLQRLLLTPEREVLVELVITKDNGEIETFNAYRVQHSNSRGPYKGGLRYHPQVDLDDVRR